MKFLLTVFLFCTTSGFLFADDSMTLEKFQTLSEIQKIQFLKSCDKSEISLKDFERASDGEFRNLLDERAQLWQDTILEGDFVQTADPYVSQVEIYRYANDVYAYAFDLKANAIKISDSACYFDEETEKYSGEACKEGKISEKIFATSDFEFIYSKNYPVFLK